MSRISSLVSAADDIQKELVPITAWAVEVEVRGMSGQQRSTYISQSIAANEARDEGNEDPIKRLDAQLVADCTYDPEDGSKVFTDADVDMLMTKSGAVVGPLAIKALRLSGLDQAAEERLGKDFSTLAQVANQAAVLLPSESSGSTSPENSNSAP